MRRDTNDLLRRFEVSTDNVQVCPMVTGCDCRPLTLNIFYDLPIASRCGRRHPTSGMVLLLK